MLANAVLLILIGGSTFDIVSGAEHWPFSPYNMYSGGWKSREFSRYRLFGTTGTGQEIELIGDGQIHPFDQCRLAESLGRAIKRSAHTPTVLNDALMDCLDRYEANKAAGLHSGPDLSGVRLYKLTWRYEDGATNYQETRNVVAEIR